jgi:hypothetical protein
MSSARCGETGTQLGQRNAVKGNGGRRQEATRRCRRGFGGHCHIYRIYCLLLASVAGPVLMKSTPQRFWLRPKNRLYLLNVTKPSKAGQEPDAGAKTTPNLNNKRRTVS